jgi:hypothetical protein
MKQSKLMSWVETCLNTAIGFGISLAAQMFFLPLLGVQIAFHQNIVFALIMTVISIARGFVLRRVFEALHIRRPLSAFAQAVIAERVRQIEQEGWTPDHDDNEHHQGELARAGACYALTLSRGLTAPDPHDHKGFARVPVAPLDLWSWSREWWKTEGGPRRSLVKACALIIAEGEKFDRARKSKRAS